MSSQKPTTKQVKVIVVGSCGVGKTALIGKYFKKDFNENTDTTISPASSHAIIKLPSGIDAHVQIWDTAGQERFQSISTMFYRDSHVALICFDINTTDTIEQWINRVHNEVPECLIMLVQTKADLLDQTALMETNAKGNQMKNEFKAHSFYLTSAVDGRMVENVFFDSALYAVCEDKTETAKSEEQKEKGSCC